MSEKYDVFISYSSKDKDVAFYLLDKIEKQGIKCWIAPRNEIAGLTYAHQILRAIENSYVVLVCFSTNANTSEHVESEVDIAYCAGKIIIPFRIDECEMSAGLRYYLNKKHWLNGIPIDEEAVEKLISSIIANIPEYAKSQEMERSIDNAMVVVSNLLSKSEDMDTAVSIQKDDSMMARLDKLKQLYNSIKELEENLIYAATMKTFIEENAAYFNDSGKGKSKYDFLANAKGELMLIIHTLKGVPDNSILAYDESVDNIILKKNQNSVIILESISKSIFPYLKNNERILVVEIDDDNQTNPIVNQYYSTIKEYYNTNNLPQTHNLTQEQIASYPNSRYDILQDKDGNVLIIISAIPGEPINGAAIYDDKRLLIIKNKDAVITLDDLPAKTIELFANVETVKVYETFKGEAVAQYELRLLPTDNIDL